MLPMLRYPAMNVPFIPQTDASSASIGYIFVQKGSEGKEMEVAILMSADHLGEMRVKFTVSEQEYLAVVECIKANKGYLSRTKNR